MLHDKRQNARDERGDVANRTNVAETRRVEPLRPFLNFAERSDAGQKLIKNRAQEVNVASFVVAADASRSLQRGVLDRPLVFPVRVVVVGQEPEVEQNRLPGTRQHNIRQLHIAVLVPAFEGVIERRTNVGNDAGRALRLDDSVLLRLHLFAERSPLDEVHHHVVIVLRRLRLVNRRDVRMPQLDAEFGFPRKFVDRRLVLAEPSPQDLHRDDFPGRLVNATENSGERAGTDHVLNAVIAVIKAGRFAARQPLDLVLRQLPEPLRRL